MSKMLKISMSGTYKNQAGVKGEVIDFEKVGGLIPFCETERVMQNAQRMLHYWIEKDKRYDKRYQNLHSVYVDKVEEVEADNPITGKDIKEMEWVDLQYLAIMKQLNGIPLYKKGSLREAREKAYLIYSDKVKREFIDMDSEEYSYSNLPALIIKDDGFIAAEEPKITNKEVLEAAEKDNIKPNFEELKVIAQSQGQKFSPNIGYNTLYERVFPSN